MRKPANIRVPIFYKESPHPANIIYTDPSSGWMEEMQLLSCYNRKGNFLFLQIEVFLNSNLVVAMPPIPTVSTNQEEVKRDLANLFN